MHATTPLLLVLGLSAVAGQDEDRPSAAALMEADRAFQAATAARGLEGWLGWFAEDAAVLKPNGEAVRGAEAVREYYANLPGFPPAGFRWEPKRAGLASAGDLGWTAGTYSTAEVANAGQYLSVWKRQSDGSWRVLTDLGGDPDFRSRVTGLEGPPEQSGMRALAAHVSIERELALTTGTWTAEGAGRTLRGRYLTVWKKTDDGWAVVTEIGVTDS